MKSSRGWAVLCLLSVVVGGTAMAAGTVYDLSLSTMDYEFSIGAFAFLVLLGGVSGLIGGVEQRRAKILGWAGLIVGLVLLFVVDGLVALGPYIYDTGIMVLVVTGIGLFSMNSGSSRKQSADGF